MISALPLLKVGVKVGGVVHKEGSGCQATIRQNIKKFGGVKIELKGPVFPDNVHALSGIPLSLHFNFL